MPVLRALMPAFMSVLASGFRSDLATTEAVGIRMPILTLTRLTTDILIASAIIEPTTVDFIDHIIGRTGDGSIMAGGGKASR